MPHRFNLVLVVSALFLAGSPAPADDLVYVLQHDLLSQADLENTGVEWMVLEPTRDGGPDGDLTPAQLDAIRDAQGCATTILAYLSIGEAEDYRPYWDDAWTDAGGHPIPGVAPAWLGPLNPNFAGNYKVRFWDASWQALMFGTAAGPGKTPLDRILDQGFDGVYLDIIDGYEYWSGLGGPPELTRAQARVLMIDFVVDIAEYARTTRGVAGFLVFPQNAAEIIRDDDELLDADSTRYFDAISGLGQEDLYYDELSAQPAASTDYVMDQIDEFLARGKDVLVTDYVVDADDQTPGANDARVTDFITRARADGLIPYAAISDRDLITVVSLPGPAWSTPQPATACAPGCPADCDGSGVLNLDDIDCFVAAFLGGDLAAADCDGSGALNLDDIDCFVASFVAGCP